MTGTRLDWGSQQVRLQYLLALAALVALAALWPLLPVDSYLGRNDLKPWTMLCTAVFMAILACDPTPGPHPQLRPMSTLTGRVARRLACFGFPFAVLSASDAARALFGVVDHVTTAAVTEGRDALDSEARWKLTQGVIEAAGFATAMVVLCLVVATCAWLARDEGRTAWRPPSQSRSRMGPSVFGLLGVFLALTLDLSRFFARAVGRSVGADDTWDWAAHGLAGFLVELSGAPVLAGVSFVFAGVMWHRPIDVAQRVTAGAPRVALPYVRLAALPTATLFVVSFSLKVEPAMEIFAIAVAICTSAVFLFPAATPVGCTVLLHEVRPISLVSEPDDPTTGADSRPPSGVLRFSPTRLRRTGLTRFWTVAAPTGSTDGLEPLWRELSVERQRHVVGKVSLAERNQRVRLDRLELETEGQVDRALLGNGDNQERDLALVYPNGPGFGDVRQSYVWQDARAAARVLHVDAADRMLTLAEGTVVQLSSGLVSHLFEVEFGQPVWDRRDLETSRPQVEDYVAP